MKTKPYFLILPVIIVLAWLGTQAFNPAKGPHGGTVKPSAGFYTEAGKNPKYIFAYLLDSTMSPVSNDGITCVAVFDFPDKTVGNLDLLPYGKDGFRAPLIDRNYKVCTIIFERNGKKISTEFENENLVVINE